MPFLLSPSLHAPFRSSTQFRGCLAVVGLHPGAHTVLGCGAPSAPGPAAEPPTASHSPAPSGSQRPPCHLSKPGPAAHRPRRRGPPWGPAGSPGESGWSLPVQRDGSRPLEVQPWQLGSHGGADPPPRPGCQVLPVSRLKYPPPKKKIIVKVGIEKVNEEKVCITFTFFLTRSSDSCAGTACSHLVWMHKVPLGIRSSSTKPLYNICGQHESCLCVPDPGFRANFRITPQR